MVAKTNHTTSPQDTTTLKSIPESDVFVLRVSTKVIGDNRLKIKYQQRSNQYISIKYNFSNENEQIDFKTLVPDSCAELSLLKDGSIEIKDCDAQFTLDLTSPATIVNVNDLGCKRLKLTAKNLLLKHNITTRKSCSLTYEQQLENYGKLTAGTTLIFQGNATSLLSNFGKMVANDKIGFNGDLYGDAAGKVINYGLIYAPQQLIIHSRRLYNYYAIISIQETVCYGKKLYNLGIIFSEKYV